MVCGRWWGSGAEKAICFLLIGFTTLHRTNFLPSLPPFQSQAMKIVKTVGQAFEVCHKISHKSPQLDNNNGDDCSETPCDTSEQDRFSEVISQGDEDEFETIPRKGERRVYV